EEVADALAQVDQLKLAACSLGGDVHAHHPAQPGTIHVTDLAEVQDEALGVRNQGFDFFLECCNIVACQVAAQSHYRGIFHSVDIQLQAGSRNLRGIRCHKNSCSDSDRYLLESEPSFTLPCNRPLA